MKTIKSTTKKGRELRASYLGAQYTELYQIYNRFSFRKQLAYDYCRSRMLWEAGSNFRIMSWNTFGFTCGWTNPDGNIRVETKDNSYLIKIE